jgi:hypothetical protein
MEIWKDVKGFENYYQVSNLGNIINKIRFINQYNGGVRIIDVKIKKVRLNKGGYLRCNLKVNGNSKDMVIHRLVAEAFIPNPENKPQVNHINGIKTDNRVENLEWVTKSENTTHAVKNRLIKTKLTDSQVLDIYNDNRSLRNIAKDYNINQSIIWRIKNKKAYKHLWQYI